MTAAVPRSNGRMSSDGARIHALEIDLAEHKATDNAVLGEIRSDIGELKRTALHLAGEMDTVKTAVTQLVSRHEGIREGQQAPWWAAPMISAIVIVLVAFLGFTGWLGGRVLDDERQIAQHQVGR